MPNNFSKNKPAGSLARFRSSKPMFKTNAEARAYFKGRLKELSVRAGMRVSELRKWAEHTSTNTYVSRKAHSLSMMLDALNEDSKTKHSEVWVLTIHHGADVAFPRGRNSIYLYHNPMDAEQAGQNALSEQSGLSYSVDVKEVK